MKMLFAIAPAITLGALSAFAPSANAANLLSNPGFETGDFTGWQDIVNGAVTSNPPFVIETIRTGTYGARIFPTGQIIQQVVIPTGVDQLRFGGYLRFLSFFPFGGNFDQGQISLGVFPNPSITLGTNPNGLTSSATALGSNASEWLFFEGVLNVAGLGGQTALFNLNLQDFGTFGDTAVAFDDLFVEAVPTTPVPTPALLPGLIGLGVAALRQRQQEDEAEEG